MILRISMKRNEWIEQLTCALGDARSTGYFDFQIKGNIDGENISEIHFDNDDMDRDATDDQLPAKSVFVSVSA